MRYRVEVEYWRVEVFEIEADSESDARVKATQQEFQDLLGGEFKVLAVKLVNARPICAVCHQRHDPDYPCHCAKHKVEMRDGLCDDCSNEDVAENGPN